MLQFTYQNSPEAFRDCAGRLPVVVLIPLAYPCEVEMIIEVYKGPHAVGNRTEKGKCHPEPLPYNLEYCLFRVDWIVGGLREGSGRKVDYGM